MNPNLERRDSVPLVPVERSEPESADLGAGGRPPGNRLESLAPWLLGGLVVLATLIRFSHLGDWNLEATEIFTLRDSKSPRLTNPRPLIYFLNYYLVRPFMPLDEFGLRLLPAIFGALAIPAFYFVARRLVGTRAALLGSLLLTVSPVHVYYSQFARYWSLVFLLCAVYPDALYLGIREKDRRFLAVGIISAILAALAHPVSILLLGGLALLLANTYLRPRQLAQLWKQSAVRWGTLGTIIVAGAIAVWFVPILKAWIAQHDKTPGSGQFFMRPPGRQGLKQVLYLLNFGESLTAPLVLAALAGIYLLWRERDRMLGLLLVCLAAFPIGFLTLVSLRTPVSTYYLLPSAPVFFLGAGVFLDYLFDVSWSLRPRWVVPATVTTILVIAGLPTLISDQRDGRRYDYRDVARWLQPRVSSGDIIYSDQHMVLAHYLPGPEVLRLRDPAVVVEAFRKLRQSGRDGALWIVLPAPSHAFRTNPKLGVLSRWMYANCQLSYSTGIGRIDLRQNYLQTFRCPGRTAGGEPARSR